jgi:hypothetical protein
VDSRFPSARQDGLNLSIAARRSRGLSLLLLLLLPWLCFGESSAPSGQSKPARPLVGYGLVNRWHTIDPVELADLLAENGLNFTQIEYVPWFDEKGKEGLSAQTDVNRAVQFVAAMRARQITTLITVVNWNGPAQREQGEEWFAARLDEIKNRVGVEWVILEGVSEPEGEKSHRWMELARQTWPGMLAANGDGGRGRPHGKDFDFITWHWCRDFTSEDVKPQPYINSTDCRPVINPGPRRAAAMARAAREKGCHLIIYDFDGDHIDSEVIRALGVAHAPSGATKNENVPVWERRAPTRQEGLGLLPIFERAFCRPFGPWVTVGSPGAPP